MRRERRQRATTAPACPARVQAPGLLFEVVYSQADEHELARIETGLLSVGPRLARYLDRLSQRLKTAGYAGPVLIMQSHGGVMPIEEATRLAAGAVLSGPAGGVAGSRHAGRLLAEGNLIPFDMGGTSTDISLVVEGASHGGQGQER